MCKNDFTFRSLSLFLGEWHALGLGINHFDRDGFFSGNAGCDFGGKDTGAVINGSVTDQETLGLFGDFPVKGGHEFVHGLDKRHLAAEGRVHVGKLQPNVTGPDNGHPFGHKLQLQRTVAGVDRLFVHGNARRNKRNRTRSQNNIL